MGIPNFKKFILSKTNNPIKKINFTDFKNKTICIDTNIFIYKYVTAIRKTGKDIIKDGKIVSHLIGIKNQINLFTKLGIKIIYVFDGKPPQEKNNIIEKRKAKNTFFEQKYLQNKQDISSFQNSFYITDEIINDTKEFLIKNNIDFIHEPNFEADIICANLVKNKKADCVYTTDFDILAFGAKCMIFNINYKKKYFEIIELKYILQELEINYNQFLNIIVLSGCDYCDKKYTLNSAYKNIISGEKIILNSEMKKAKKIFKTTFYF